VRASSVTRSFASSLVLALALASSIVAAACGFGPEQDFAGARTGDGIAPWTDLGPAAICVGNEFLGPPGSPPGGFCFDRNRPESPCRTDDDCASREACTCGRCTVQYCTSASDCDRGRVCTFGERRCDVACADASACAAGEECRNGVCRGRCETSAECQLGEVCSSRNVCVTDECAADSACMASETCHLQRAPRVVVEPSPLAGAPSPRVTLYLEVGDAVQPDRRAIWRALSTDGIHFRFDPAHAVLEDAGAAHAPSAVADAGGVTLYYEAGDGVALKVARAADGVSFGPPAIALAGGAGAAAVRAPAAVVLPDGSAAVYYQQGDGTAIALATGALGGALTSRGPVLTPADVTIAPGAPRAPVWADVVRLRSPFAAITSGPAGPSLRLWFAGFGRESADSQQFGDDVPIPANHSIGYAAGDVDDPSALVPWRYGPVVDRVDAFLEHREELGPGVVQLVDAAGPEPAYLLYYVEATPAAMAVGPAGPFTLGRLGVLANGGVLSTGAR
jgi:hypothetical protein